MNAKQYAELAEASRKAAAIYDSIPDRDEVAKRIALAEAHRLHTALREADKAKLLAAIAKAEVAVSNAWHTAEKLEQGDSWHDGHRLHFGRHAKAAQTRLAKRERELARLKERFTRWQF